ncbi:ATP-dependent helicase/deoxyribonuclease subunit B [Erysipelotrichaceae bacterium]|nr:ATP-dependent helicase/deoxyribonuclease subunit B [Erysipelotrichaceae bacterium]
MITFIKGRSGRGKTDYILQEITKSLTQNPEVKQILIVPDQMSFQTEYELLHRFDSKVMVGVEVVGIHRFVARMLEDSIPYNFVQAETLAQKMLMQESAIAVEKKLDIYAKSVHNNGFVEYLHQFFRQIRGSNVEIEQLAEIDNLGTYPLLAQKINETVLIFKQYEKYISADLLDTSDRIKMLVEKLDDDVVQQKIGQYDIYIDGFYTYNEQEFLLLCRVIELAKKAMVTFNTDDAIHKVHSIFTITQRVFKRFESTFSMATCIDLSDHKQSRFRENAALDFFEKNYESPRNFPEGVTWNNAINLTEYHTKEAEVEGVAQKIRRLLLSGTQASEIGIYLPESQAYTPIIEKIFDQYEIPYYIDIKESMMSHPLIQWLYLLLKITKENWQYEDIVQLIQNDFFCWSQEILPEERYQFLSHLETIRTEKKYVWTTDRYWIKLKKPSLLSTEIDEEITAILAKIRSAILAQIAGMESSFKNSYNNEILEQIFEFIIENNALSYLETIPVNQSRYTSHITEQQYKEQIWENLITVFEQANIAIGVLKVKKGSVIWALMFGLESMEFTSIPLGFDTVMVGDFERSRFQTIHQENSSLTMGIQYGFVLGLVEQYIPYIESANSLFSVKDFAIFHKNAVLEDILIAGDAIVYQLFRLYTILTCPAKKLEMSYFQYDGIYKDIEMNPSTILDMFSKNGFNIPKVMGQSADDSINYQEVSIPFIKKRLAERFTNISTSADIQLLETLKKIDPVFVQHLEKAFNYRNSIVFEKSISIHDTISLTQIETYNSCPYKYFLQYIIGVKEPYDGKLLMLTSGTILHDFFESLIQNVINNQEKLTSQPLEVHLLEVESYFQARGNILANHPLFLQYSNQYLFRKIGEIANTSMKALYEQELYHSFTPKYIEKILPPLLLDIAKNKKIIGKVDRIDISDDQKSFRIIDYKSSQRSLDFDKIDIGTQLQLPLYSYLATQMMQQKLVGSMYIPLHEKRIIVEGDMNLEVGPVREKTFQAAGFFLDDIESLTLFDSRIAENKKSNTIPYSTKKDGSLTNSSAVLSEVELNALQQFALSKAEQTISKIIQGKFDVEPIRQNFDNTTAPCVYCKFRRICQFDRKINSYRECKTSNMSGFQAKKQVFLEENKLTEKVEKGGGMDE